MGLLLLVVARQRVPRRMLADMQWSRAQGNLGFPHTTRYVTFGVSFSDASTHCRSVMQEKWCAQDRDSTQQRLCADTAVYMHTCIHLYALCATHMPPSLMSLQGAHLLWFRLCIQSTCEWLKQSKLCWEVDMLAAVSSQLGRRLVDVQYSP